MTKSWDLIFVGGGLANGLIAYRLLQQQPTLRTLVIDAGAGFGGNHTWSFHETDLSPAERQWTAPLVEHRWPAYTVAFPGFVRRVDLAYCSATSERFHEVLTGAGVRGRFGVEVTDLSPTTVRLAEGGTLEAGAVIDGRGPGPMRHLRFAWQKFVGREFRLRHPHRLSGPIVMDATVAQADGFRFVYVLPFAPDRLLVEDTYYADGPALDIPASRDRIDAYLNDKGWVAEAVLREETGVLPITLDGNLTRFWADRHGQPCAGLRAGLFHPTTGYSLPDAVRLADRIAALSDLSPEALFAAIRRIAGERWAGQRLFRLLNRLLFLAGAPEARWAVLRRFYGFPDAMVARFYAGDLATADKLRLLIGKPPVPFRGAVRAMMDRRTE